jgi:hypothetical protein
MIITESERNGIIKLLAKLINNERLSNCEVNDAGYIRHRLMGLEDNKTREGVK